MSSMGGGGLVARILFGPRFLIVFMVMWVWMCFFIVVIDRWEDVLKDAIVVFLWCRLNMFWSVLLVGHAVAQVIRVGTCSCKELHTSCPSGL